MPDIYVERQLTVDDATNGRTVAESDLLSVGHPLIVLGDAGMGKTRLMQSLARRLGTKRISAGSFARTANLSDLRALSGTPIIIDGLDELVSSSGASGVDEILKKLSTLGRPDFILSCRVADWNGSADRYKIREDYGVGPTTARLEPFSRDDASKVLSANGLAADELLDELDRRDLEEFYRNPLTLTLIAKIAKGNEGLPSGRADLLDRASRILVQEDNGIHQRSRAGMANPDELLESAGAVFAHLLLSGISGVADLPAAEAPPAFVGIGDIGGLPDAPLAQVALKTRLFEGAEEKLLVPYHRVIAEFLAGKWLAKRLERGLSERRIIQALTFAGGVPTALRGVHAWLGHFAPRMTAACIQRDPYGALRYGDPERLSLPHARLLLNSLRELAEDDPYFRSEDWGRRAVTGLARTELKPDILDLLKRPDRHVHLSSLILEALAGSMLAEGIAPELIRIVRDERAFYIERRNAAEALMRTGELLDWPSLARGLCTASDQDGRRLAIELIGSRGSDLFPSIDVASVLLDYYEILNGPRNGRRVIGIDYQLLKSISSEKSGEVLDEIANRAAPLQQSPHWRMGHEIAWTIARLLSNAIQAKTGLTPARVWRWLRLLEGQRGFHDEEREGINSFLRNNSGFRREIQRFAFSEDTTVNAPWMAVVSDLPEASSELSVTEDDAVFFLNEIAAKNSLSDFDVELWGSMLQISRGRSGFPASVENSAQNGIRRHAELQRHWEEITAPPQRDWQKEEDARLRRIQRDREQRFRKHREEFYPLRAEIANGNNFGALHSLANAYLGRYYDLPNDADAVDRLNAWVGADLAKAATSGFIKMLQRSDLPTAAMIGKNRAEDRNYIAESVVICGVAELRRNGLPFSSVNPEVLKTALACWWEYADAYTERLGANLGPELEAAVFSSDESTCGFLEEVLEPQIKAGHSHISGLYRLSRDIRYRNVVGQLALKWLEKYPKADLSVQRELIDSAIRFAPKEEFVALARTRVSSGIGEGERFRALWMGALFIADFERSKEVIKTFGSANTNNIFAIRDSIRSDDRQSTYPLSAGQLEFIVEIFAKAWPPADLPSDTALGDSNAWSASEFIRASIQSLAADKSQESSEALERLAQNPHTAEYHDYIKHARASQMRLRRDTEYQAAAFSEVKAMLDAGLPGTVDDLKAVLRDALADVQDYIRNGDTMAWKAFWSGEKPNSEETCRDRLIDYLQGRLAKSIAIIPETRMPDEKRTDIGAIYNGLGIPIEVKGQWHSNVWDASSDQLIELYTKDYRAKGRGIYLVLWFGSVPGKNLPRHPSGLAKPATPAKLREMLVDGLDPSERNYVDVIVLDVSRIIVKQRTQNRRRQRSSGKTISARKSHTHRASAERLSCA